MDPVAIALIVSACGLSSVPRLVVHAQPPVYPDLARRARVEREQWVVVKVRPDGIVESAEVEGDRAPMGLAPASEEAAKQWRFAPAKSEHILRLRFEFRLADRCDPKAPGFEWLSAYSLRVWERMPEMATYVFGSNGCVKVPPPPCPGDDFAQPPS